MARNRKSQSAAIRFGPALKAALLCLLIGGAGVGYVWQKDQLVRLGEQRKLRETTLARLEQQNERLQRQLTCLCSPQYLEQRSRDLKLGLVLPQPSQILYVTEPMTDMSKSNLTGQYASENQHSLIMP